MTHRGGSTKPWVEDDARFLYDGAEIIGEFNASNVLQRRFIPGSALDEPIACDPLPEISLEMS